MERTEIEEKLLLQLITNRGTEDGILGEVKDFLEGGGRWVQLRMKDAAEDDIVETGLKVKALCREYGAVFIVNDNPGIALRIGADGVHIGKNDILPDAARKMLGNDAVIGCTANTIEDIERLAAYGIDYIGLGPFRFTRTKKNLSPVLGMEGYGNILTAMKIKGIDIPVVAIGGICLADIAGLKKSGVKFFAVAGAISGALDPRVETEGFLNRLLNTF